MDAILPGLLQPHEGPGQILASFSQKAKLAPGCFPVFLPNDLMKFDHDTLILENP
tara:strand:+ start:226 stop:390 length:165 start_codon:yes stop_codon:yes gene_type:complete